MKREENGGMDASERAARYVNNWRAAERQMAQGGDQSRLADGVTVARERHSHSLSFTLIL